MLFLMPYCNRLNMVKLSERRDLMKKLGSWILMPLSIIVVLILSVSSDSYFASPHFFRNGLNTKK